MIEASCLVSNHHQLYLIPGCAGWALVYRTSPRSGHWVLSPLQPVSGQQPVMCGLGPSLDLQSAQALWCIRQAPDSRSLASAEALQGCLGLIVDDKVAIAPDTTAMAPT